MRIILISIDSTGFQQLFKKNNINLSEFPPFILNAGGGVCVCVEGRATESNGLLDVMCIFALLNLAAILNELSE